MDVCVLDDQLRRDTLIDDYGSMIWTERWTTPGDFELQVMSTSPYRSLFAADTMLAIPQLSERVMVVEDVDDSVNEDGDKILKITGRSLEKILEDRVAKKTYSTIADEPSWNFTNVSPQSILTTVYNAMIVTGLVPTLDSVPFTVNASTITGSIAFPTDKITKSYDPQSVMEIFTDISSTYPIGYRLLRKESGVGSPSAPKLVMEIYSGNDLTTYAEAEDPVIFSSSMGTLQNTRTFNSVAGFKNAAYVFGQQSLVRLNIEELISDPKAFARKVLCVDASDILNADIPTLNNLLIQKGKEELAKVYKTYAFDGEITPDAVKVYGKDYLLGDRIELHDQDDVANLMRVSEFIFSDDSEGERAYPTLTLDYTIQTTTWSGTDPALEWADEPDLLYWSNS